MAERPPESPHRRTFLRFVAALAVLAVPWAAAAGEADYRLELAGPPTKVGEKLLLQVRHAHVPDGKPVTDATVAALRFDMAPDDMAGMSAPVSAAANPAPGVYGFETQPSMPGNWALHLRATLPNLAPLEAAPVITVPN